MKTLTDFAATGLFDARVPRYTSYPTAPHFTPDVGPDEFMEWVSSVNPSSAVSLYFHIPFCPRLCWFCACRTQGVQTAEPVEAYLNTMMKNIDATAALLPGGTKVRHIHWGGGSPTILTPSQMARLNDRIASRFSFDDDIEFSVEIDPCSMDADKIKALADAGMSRASLGVQDFDEKVQNAIGRLQGYDLTKATIDGLREAGISSLNLDMVYGLPYQSADSLTETADKVVSLNPDRLALYGYAHVPWMAKRQKLIPEESLPDAQARFSLFDIAAAKFESAGMKPVGIDHFAKPGDKMAEAARTGSLRRNFQGYTTDEAPTLIGIGASAISRFSQGYVQNHATTGKYLRAVEEGEHPIARGYSMRLIDQIRAEAIESLMCRFELDLNEIKDRYGDFSDVLLPEMRSANAEFAALTSLSADVLRLSPDAKPLTRLIASRFDAFLSGNDHHSAAI